MKRYFILGTDTDSGKTYVTNQLQGVYPTSMAIKPVSSGCSKIGGQLICADAELFRQSNPMLSTLNINPWRFELAASPHIAAKMEGKKIDVEQVVQFCLNFQSGRVDRLFIEGAGGLMVPLNNTQTWLDFLILSGIPVILVVGLRLGCINHALLTAKLLETQNISLKGWIANCLDPQLLCQDEVIQTLSQWMPVPLLSTLPYLGVLNRETSLVL